MFSTTKIFIVLMVTSGTLAPLSKAENKNKRDLYQLKEDCLSEESSCYIHVSFDIVRLFTDEEELPVKKINCRKPQMFTMNDTSLTQSVQLNGCSYLFNAQDLGLQYLDFCHQINYLWIKQFYVDLLPSIQCSQRNTTEEDKDEQQGENESLMRKITLYNNTIGHIAARSFYNLKHLEEIYFVNNAINYIERGAFDQIPSLKSVAIEKDHILNIIDPQIFQNSSIRSLTIVDIKKVDSKMFSHLPKGLSRLKIERVELDSSRIKVENPKSLSKIIISDCGIKSFTLIDEFQKIHSLILSKNLITDLHLPKDTSLQLLDLSENEQQYLSSNILTSMPNLRHLILKNNQLKTLSVESLLEMAPLLYEVDLTYNHLDSLIDFPEYTFDLNMKLKTSGNPWNCSWLVNLAERVPGAFAILEYEKFRSKYSVNGLECVSAETKTLSSKSERPTNDDLTIFEVTEEILPSPQTTKNNEKVNTTVRVPVITDAPRPPTNQKFEALVIIFLLPCGIGFLFLILYLWLYCHKIFSFSFYNCFDEKTDQVPSDKLEGFDTYEVPINCPGIQEVTYEPVPHGVAVSAYEEIHDLRRPSHYEIP